MDYGLKYWLNHPIHRKVLTDKKFKPLTAKQIKRVEKFVFFTGYPQSGHSIVGSLLDAHPNAILSYSFFLFRQLMTSPNSESNMNALLQNKTLFFNALYERSYRYSMMSSKKWKGYSLDVPGLWSGKFKGRLKIVGDKSALSTTMEYGLTSPAHFKARYEDLRRCVGVPLMTIHVVRNPFDMIATHTIYHSTIINGSKVKDKSTWSAENKFNNKKLLEKCVDFIFDKAKAVEEMIPLCGMNVLEIHSEDLVKDPRRELDRMCQFLEVECSEVYLKACEKKVYRNVSRTRDKVYWPPYIKAQVIENIQKYSFFRGYTYDDDFYNPSQYFYNNK